MTQGLNYFDLWIKHQETDALLKRLIKQRRTQTWRHFCEKMANGEYTKSIARLSRIRKNRTLKPSFSPEPTLDKSPEDLMAEHFQGIYAGQLLPTITSTHATNPIEPGGAI